MCWVAHVATGFGCVTASVGVLSVHVTVLMDLTRRLEDYWGPHQYRNTHLANRYLRLCM
jgi:hypothetical protein